MPGQGILHVNAVRLRLNGAGFLKLALFSLDDEQTQPLLPLGMNTKTDIEPTRLANFKSQRISLEISTTEMDDYFRVNRIIAFAKPMYSGGPGNY